MSMLSIISIMEKGRTYSKDEIHNILTDKGLRPGSRDNTKSTIYKMVRKGKLIRVDKDCYKLPDNQNRYRISACTQFSIVFCVQIDTIV